MYARGYSLRTIAKFLKVSAQSVFVWMKKFAKNNYSKPAPTDDSVVIELDEMWHFCTQKKTNLDLESLLRFILAIVMVFIVISYHQNV